MHTRSVHDIPALGAWSGDWEPWAAFFDGIPSIWHRHEPDRGGETVQSGSAARLFEIEHTSSAFRCQDASAFHLADPDAFRPRFEAALAEARPWRGWPAAEDARRDALCSVKPLAES